MSIKTKSYTDDTQKTVLLGQELGRGGQGAVFQIVDEPQMVAKIYLNEPDNQLSSKLRTLVRANEPRLQEISAWPTRLLYNNNSRVCGFVMPLISNREYHELHNLYRYSSRLQNFPEANWRFMVHVARNIARAFVVLHARDYLMGDVSPRNVMVSEQGVVQLIDIDSFQVRVNSAVFHCQVATAEFTAPELQNTNLLHVTRSEKHDLFGLALLIFHLLFEGRHPYSGVHDDGSTPSPAQAIAAHKFAYSLKARATAKPPPGAINLNQLHPSIRNLFERAFAKTARSRPTAIEWEKALEDLFKNIVVCKHNSSHFHDGRLPCPWCVLEAQVQNEHISQSKLRRYDARKELQRLDKLLQTIPPPPHPANNHKTWQGVQPLPLAEMPSAPPVIKSFLWESAFYGTLYMVGFIFALFNGWSWHYYISFFLLAMSDLAKNAPQNLRKRQDKNEIESRRTQLLEYQARLEDQRQELANSYESVNQKLNDAYSRQQTSSANAKYHMTVGQIVEMSQEISFLEENENTELKAVIDKAREVEMAKYLSQQSVEECKGYGFGILAMDKLRKNGILTANDVDERINKIRGLSLKHRQSLWEWRRTLEGFFYFDTNSVPKENFDEVRKTLDKRKAKRIAEMEAAIFSLAEQIRLWQAYEETVRKEIRQLRKEVYLLEISTEAVNQEIDSLQIP